MLEARREGWVNCKYDLFILPVMSVNNGERP